MLLAEAFPNQVPVDPERHQPRRRQRGRTATEFLDPPRRVGMRGEKFRNAPRLLSLEPFEECLHPLRRQPGAVENRESVAIGLGFLLPAVGETGKLVEAAGKPREVAAPRHQRDHRRTAELPHELLQPMPVKHVLHLVSEHARDLLRRFRRGEQAREHDDLPARHREGVHPPIVDDVDVERVARVVGRRLQPFHDPADRVASRSIVDPSLAREHPLHEQPAELHLGGHGHGQGRQFRHEPRARRPAHDDRRGQADQREDEPAAKPRRMAVRACGEALEHAATGLVQTGRDRGHESRLANDHRRHAFVERPRTRESDPRPLIAHDLADDRPVRPANHRTGCGPDREPTSLDGHGAWLGAGSVGDEAGGGKGFGHRDRAQPHPRLGR